MAEGLSAAEVGKEIGEHKEHAGDGDAVSGRVAAVAPGMGAHAEPLQASHSWEKASAPVPFQDPVLTLSTWPSSRMPEILDSFLCLGAVGSLSRR